ncbi:MULTISPECIES: DUF2690 domain-containing protein [unclassified Streptomyces]|uniref:DUF2690 domain-containing protein n=1 Tax=unclassified Streptomyces TaxID=2593676 RepID=UPI0006F20DD1|nr:MULTISPECIES: DUF2690 domain-containing protein [unclassified Streptomyces]KQX58818.1 hypothetical protein ASD33_00445 [Streptomyces sp. Root1304]KRB00079.1 hypothetical protein ASE09_00445 [Streptomyces sp. Root66D1]
MNILTRKFATVGSALVMAGSSLLLASSPASAATSCYSTSCYGVDPATSICQNDARTVLTSETGVELRYSPTCRATWARKQNAVAGHYYQVENERREMQSVQPGGSGGTVWTRMVDDKDIMAYACDRRSDYTMASSTLWW